MTTKVIIPVADFAAIVNRLEAVERKLEARVADGIFHYGPCLRCGYGPWDSVSPNEPRCCPRCHSAYWDRPPRKASARRPEDPPLPRWDPNRRTKRRGDRAGYKHAPAIDVAAPVVEAAPPTRPAIVLPPELRPPGEPLIPPPPRVLPDVIAARTVDNPMNARPVEIAAPPVAPTEHVAVLPAEIVERILATGEGVTYDEIKAAREGGDASASDTPMSETVREAPTRPTDPSLQAKKDSFFASAIEAGLVSAEPESAPIADSTPFVAETEAPSLAPKPDDDPFWK